LQVCQGIEKGHLNGLSPPASGKALITGPDTLFPGKGNAQAGQTGCTGQNISYVAASHRSNRQGIASLRVADQDSKRQRTGPF
jgi:hypothetical protein